METNVNSLLKLKSNVSDNREKLKIIRADFDLFSQFRRGDQESQEFKNQQAALHIENIIATVTVTQETVENCKKKISEFTEKLHEVEENITDITLRNYNLMQMQLIDQNTKLEALGKRCSDACEMT
jgi:hypothetical protein